MHEILLIKNCLLVVICLPEISCNKIISTADNQAFQRSKQVVCVSKSVFNTGFDTQENDSENARHKSIKISPFQNKKRGPC